MALWKVFANGILVDCTVFTMRPEFIQKLVNPHVVKYLNIFSMHFHTVSLTNTKGHL